MPHALLERIATPRNTAVPIPGPELAAQTPSQGLVLVVAGRDWPVAERVHRRDVLRADRIPEEAGAFGIACVECPKAVGRQSADRALRVEPDIHILRRRIAGLEVALPADQVDVGR